MGCKIVNGYLNIFVSKKCLDFFEGKVKIQRVWAIEIVVGGILMVFFPVKELADSHTYERPL